jgi:hypothetical protein
MCLRRNLPVGRVAASIERADSGQAAHPAVIANVANGFALTGGGAEVQTNGPGSLLWMLEPTTGNNSAFAAASKDHLDYSPATLSVYSIGIRLE